MDIDHMEGAEVMVDATIEVDGMPPQSVRTFALGPAHIKPGLVVLPENSSGRPVVAVYTSGFEELEDIRDLLADLHDAISGAIEEGADVDG